MGPGAATGIRRLWGGERVRVSGAVGMRRSANGSQYISVNRPSWKAPRQNNEQIVSSANRQGGVLITFVNRRGILLVGDFSSADMWQYPPPCIKIPIMGISPIASRSISEGSPRELEPDASDTWWPCFCNKLSFDKRMVECMHHSKARVTYLEWSQSLWSTVLGALATRTSQPLHRGPLGHPRSLFEVH